MRVWTDSFRSHQDALADIEQYGWKRVGNGFEPLWVPDDVREKLAERPAGRGPLACSCKGPCVPASCACGSVGRPCAGSCSCCCGATAGADSSVEPAANSQASDHLQPLEDGECSEDDEDDEDDEDGEEDLSMTVLSSAIQTLSMTPVMISLSVVTCF